MGLLGAAVAVAIVLCLTNLLLTFGVIRRLREHSELLSRSGGGASAPVIGLAAGAAPGRFTATATDGLAVNGPDGLRIAGFFSATCSACPEQVPGFIDYLREHQVPVDAALAVIICPPSAAPPPYLNELAAVARVCQEPPAGDLAAAFKVQGYPAFCLLDDAGKVRSTGFEMRALPPIAVPVR